MMTEEPVSSSYLVVGLGNPGRRYRDDRHNIGFMVLDRLVKKLDLSFSRSQLRALVTAGQIGDNKLIFAKPQTFMNNVGNSVAPLSRYYRIPSEHILVVFDDLDLPLGTLRLRPKGGSGGHRGMRSIIQNLGTDSFPRMRLGIGRPPGQMDPASYVLQKFSTDELILADITLERTVEAIQMFIGEGIEIAMTRFNANTGS